MLSTSNSSIQPLNHFKNSLSHEKGRINSAIKGDFLMGSLYYGNRNDGFHLIKKVLQKGMHIISYHICMNELGQKRINRKEIKKRDWSTWSYLMWEVKKWKFLIFVFQSGSLSERREKGEGRRKKGADVMMAMEEGDFPNQPCCKNTVQFIVCVFNMQDNKQ